MSRFQIESGDWKQYRSLPLTIEIDLHRCDLHPSEFGEPHIPYYEKMGNVYHDSLEALRRAHAIGLSYALFVHGHSTSRPGKTTARSIVRGLMRSPEATPYIVRKDCIQHRTVFVAALKPNRASHKPSPKCPHCGSVEMTETPTGMAGRFKCGRCKRISDWFEMYSDVYAEPGSE